jgi:hypothetical protein
MTEYTSKTKITGTVDGKPVNLAVEQKGYPPFVAYFREAVNFWLKLDMDNTTWKTMWLMSLSMSKGNRISLTRQQIATRLQIHVRTASQSIKTLQNLDIIRGERGNYIFNPYIAFNGGNDLRKMVIEQYEKMPRWSIRALKCITRPPLQPEEPNQFRD